MSILTVSMNLWRRTVKRCADTTSFYRTVVARYPFLTAFLPTLLAIGGVVLLAVKPIGGLWLFVALTAYSAVFVLKGIAEYLNAKEDTRKRRRQESLERQIKHLDNLVRNKVARLNDALRNRDLSHTDDAEAALLGARKRMNLENTARALNEELAQAVIGFLRKSAGAGDANFVCRILVPSADGHFQSLGGWYKDGGTRAPQAVTALRTDDQTSVAGRLWATGGETILSYPDTEVAEAEGKFVFSRDTHRKNLKSICCYLVRDGDMGAPLAIWSIDSDKTDVFPLRDDPLLQELNNIFISFELRLRHDMLVARLLRASDKLGWPARGGRNAADPKQV